MRTTWDMGGFGILAAIIWLAVVIAIVVLVIAAVRWLMTSGRSGGQQGPAGGPPAPPSPRPDDPLEILRQRYARGEIDEEEFDRRRRTLGG